jgi:ADP-heptose:LPS heptosyltransferase
MWRTFSRIFLPNPLDWRLKRCAKKGGRKILIGWNRGLGDLALGLYAIIHRIKEIIPNAHITFLTRKNLQDGFSLLEGIDVLVASDWKRGEAYSVPRTLSQLQIDFRSFDLILAAPSPTDWVHWQRGKLVPRLRWKAAHDSLWRQFDLPATYTYIGVQVEAETPYGLWRNWPVNRWEEFFARLRTYPSIRVLLFGVGHSPLFSCSNVIDLRGKTSLCELLSIIKSRCAAVILPDSGILSMVYYLDESFSIHVISLWGDPHHGILKQNVASPNPLLLHSPLIGRLRDLSSVTVDALWEVLCPHQL